MSEQWIEVEAGSLEEARELLKSQVPEGLYLISERVISDGSVQTIKAYADSTETAFAKARSEVPEGAEIVKETKHADPKREGCTVEAADEESARSVATSQVSSRHGKEATVEDLRLVAEGKKGFLGIGRKKPNQYAVTVFQPALVEISYQGKVRIAGQVRGVQWFVDQLKAGKLSQDDPILRILETIGTPAVEPLIALLDDPNPRTRGSAIVILGEIGDQRALEPLRTVIETATDTNTPICRLAAVALAQLGDLFGQMLVAYYVELDRR